MYQAEQYQAKVSFYKAYTTERGVLHRNCECVNVFIRTFSRLTQYEQALKKKKSMMPSKHMHKQLVPKQALICRVERAGVDIYQHESTCINMINISRHESTSSPKAFKKYIN
jgi:hypothetical protein